jgi:hypothetical protein
MKVQYILVYSISGSFRARATQKLLAPQQWIKLFYFFFKYNPSFFLAWNEDHVTCYQFYVRILLAEFRFFLTKSDSEIPTNFDSFNNTQQI